MQFIMTLTAILIANSATHRQFINSVSAFGWMSASVMKRTRYYTDRIGSGRLFASSSLSSLPRRATWNLYETRSMATDVLSIDDGNITPETETTQTQYTVSKGFIPFPFAYHELIDIRIDTLTSRGWGLGRIDVSDRGEPPPPPAQSKNIRSRKPKNSDDNDPESNEDVPADDASLDNAPKKWIIMAPNVIPGELVRVRIFRNFRNYSEADLVEILEPNVEDRIVPKCPLANDCGGCQYQHMSIQSQRKWKMMAVQDSLRQYGVIDVVVSPTIGTDEVFAYRSKLTPHYEAPSKRSVKQHIEAIGFLRQTHRSIVDVPSCPIATPAVNEKYQRFRDELLSFPSSRLHGATLLLRQANLSDSVNTVSTNHNEYITTRVRGIDFTYKAGNFFQNNYYVLPLMVEQLVHYAAVPSAATGSEMTHLVDCYCGSGLFALSAASKFMTVVGIELNKVAVAEATSNAITNKITNCSFLAASAECIFASIGHFPKDSTVVVLDPPRKGCSTFFLDQLYQFAPQRIVYMSCEPHTQARDAKFLLGTGKYRIVLVQPIDLFPQTRHIECLVVFERTS
jgi:tRNA (uracil-5-)-methyltransferase